MIITGRVINREAKSEPFAKVFVSKYDGLITPKKIGTTTDENGNFTLDISNRDGEYLSASIVGAKTITAIKEDVTDYLLDLGTDKTQQIKEVTVTYNRPIKEPEQVKVKKQEPIKAPIKKSYWWIIPVAIGGLLIAGGIYYAVKRSKKN